MDKNGKITPAVAGALSAMITSRQLGKYGAPGTDDDTASEFLKDDNIKNTKVFVKQQGNDYEIWIKNEKDAFLRENKIAHITASAWVVNKDRSKVLMVYHNIYHSWSWLGGHADGETDLLSVAIREVKEEAGISKVYPVSEEIFSLESLTVDGHVKKLKYEI
jgi:hypothetical protein